MGRPKKIGEPRNWGLSVKLQKSIGQKLDAIADRLGWSRASVITELILKFGEVIVNIQDNTDESTEKNTDENTEE